jgi:hypothetical protein
MAPIGYRQRSASSSESSNTPYEVISSLEFESVDDDFINCQEAPHSPTDEIFQHYNDDLDFMENSYIQHSEEKINAEVQL